MEERDLIHIETYLNGEANAELKAYVEQRISSDTDFAEHVAFVIQAREATYRKLLAEKHRDWNASPASRKIWPAVFALTALLTIALVFAYYFLSHQESPKHLAVTAFEKEYARLPVLMGSEKDSLQLGIDYYNSGNYKLSMDIFSQYPGNPQALEYGAVAAFRNHDPEKALALAAELGQLPNVFHNKGKWLQIIVLLQENRSKEALKIYAAMSPNEAGYSDVKEILN